MQAIADVSFLVIDLDVVLAAFVLVQELLASFCCVQLVRTHSRNIRRNSRLIRL